MFVSAQQRYDQELCAGSSMTESKDIGRSPPCSCPKRYASPNALTYRLRRFFLARPPKSLGRFLALPDCPFINFPTTLDYHRDPLLVGALALNKQL